MIRMLKIIVWKNVKTNKWECIIREGDTFDWILAPAFDTKEEAIKYGSSISEYLGSEFEVFEL